MLSTEPGSHPAVRYLNFLLCAVHFVQSESHSIWSDINRLYTGYSYARAVSLPVSDRQLRLPDAVGISFNEVAV